MVPSTVLLSCSSETLCFSIRRREIASSLPGWEGPSPGSAGTKFLAPSTLLLWAPKVVRPYGFCGFWNLNWIASWIFATLALDSASPGQLSQRSLVFLPSSFQQVTVLFFLSCSLHPWQFMPKQAKKSFYCHLVSEGLKDDMCIFFHCL